MKRFFISYLMLTFSYAQLKAQESAGGNIGFLSTGKEFNLHMKNGFGLQGYMTWELDDNFRIRISAQYNKFFSTFDTLFYTYESYGGYGASYLAGYIIHKSYSVGMIMLGVDYYYNAFLYKERLRIYPGLDMFAGMISNKYFEFDTYSETEGVEGYSTGGGRFRVNFEYDIDDYSFINLEAGYSAFYENKYNHIYGFYQVSIGYSYYY